MDAKIIYKYIGTKGEYLDGIPAKDLTEADLSSITPYGITVLSKSALYELVPEKPEQAGEVSEKEEDKKSSRSRKGNSDVNSLAQN